MEMTKRSTTKPAREESVFDMPAGAVAADEPGGAGGAGPVDEEEGEGVAGEHFGNVVEDVVAALVAEDEEDFVVGNAAGGGVPDHDALGGPDAADVGVEAVGLEAGLHQNTCGWAGCWFRCGRRPFQAPERAGDSSCVSGSNLLKMGSSRGETKRLRTRMGKRGQPDAEPVAAGPAADDPVEEQENQRADDQGEAEGLGLVAEPTAPALHADAVTAADVLAEPVEGEAGKRGENEEGEKEEDALHPASGGDALGPGLDAGPGMGGQQNPEEDDAPDGACDFQDVANAAEGNGFGQLVKGERVGLLGVGVGARRGGG